jgi:arylsulfatase A-like enzyme
MDRVLGDIRLAMTKSGAWDESTVIVTGDHGWRTKAWRELANRYPWTEEDERLAGLDPTRVPFLVKLPRHQREHPYGRPVRTLVTRALVIALLQGEISSPEQLAAWLDARANSTASTR